MKNALAWLRNRGRNGWDSPQDVADDQSTESLNVHFTEGGLGTKRGGLTAVSISGQSGINQLFGGYVPGQDETARELWCVDNSSTNLIRRMAAGSTFTSITLPNDITAANDTAVYFAVLNGKLFIAYNGTTNRLKVFDPGYSTTAIRYAGLGTPAAPTTATAGGSGLTFTRWYKVAYTEQRSSVTVRRSELSAADDISITDDSGVTVTKPASISEGETHWEVYASDTETGTYYLLGTTAVGTTTFSDTNSSIPTTTAEPTAGENVPFPSVKFLYSNGSRLFGFGAWETTAGDSHTPQAGTVYTTPVLDTTSQVFADDERCRNTVSAVGRILLGRNAGGIDRGISGLGNVVYAFQSKGIYSLIPTENPNVPYRRVMVSGRLGATGQDAIREAVDQLGRPCLYFLDPEWGLYRIGPAGIQWCGKDVKDLWDDVNLAAAHRIAWMEYLPEITMLVMAYATGASDEPDACIAFDVTEGWPDQNGDVRGGWAKWTGKVATARCATIMSRTLGATMSRDLTLYVGGTINETALRKYDPTDGDDDGTDFQAYVQSKAFTTELIQNKQVDKSYLLAETLAGVTVQQTLIRNFAEESRTSTSLLTAAASETRKLAKFEDAALNEAYAVQVRLGDASAQEGAWTFDQWFAPYKTGDQR